MSENLGDSVAWYAAALYNGHGPITAIDYLDELTDEEWSKIPAKSYTYSGIGHDGETRVYGDRTKTMRARMITYEEVNDIKTANNGTTPSYMYGNPGYWTSTAYAPDSYYAWCMGLDGDLYLDNVTSVAFIGLRPVIELSK